ncbi:MAG TPA: isoprenylcysteine carboxylmethyltransferase family protein [Hyphomicrobiales bacterium]|nr:isoprenylcysteine carboxylmethyltransferase family protein [Hyphomicrobiales bacterium]
MTANDHKGIGPVNAPIFPKPPVVALLFIASGFALGYLIPLRDRGSSTPIESIVAGGAIMICAVLIAMLGARELARAGTTIHPGGSAAALVQTGVFRRSRNPLYLSLVLFLLGLGIATLNLWMIVLAPLMLLYLQERVVKREEEYLTQRFGADYLAYKRNVRRWF